MTNILYITTDSEIGGAEKVILSLCEKLNKSKYNVSILILKGKGPLTEEAGKLGIKVESLGMNRFNPFSILKIFFYLGERKIDILHTHLYHSNIIGLLVKRWKKVPFFLYTAHNVLPEKISLFQKINNFIMRNFNDEIIAVSFGVKEDFTRRAGIKKKKIEVIYNGIDLANFNYREERKVGEFLLIGTIASLKKKKGLQYLLKAAKIVLEKFPKGKFLIIGEGPERKNLEELAKSLGIGSKVIFAGFRDDISEILSTLDIFVFPSIREGLGIALIEAMAAGIPVIATDISGIKEVVENGKTGLLISVKDPKALAEAIVELLEDKEKRERLTTAARRSVEEKFALSTFIEKNEKLYCSFYEK